MTKQHPYEWTVKRGPVGVWRTAEGSFSAVSASTITFQADGSGELRQEGRLSGLHEMAFHWVMERPGHLALIPLKDADPENPDDWDRIIFQTGWRTYDIGAGPVLENAKDQDIYSTDAFYTLDGPIQLVSRPPDA